MIVASSLSRKRARVILIDAARRSGGLVVEMKRHQLDDDVGNGSGIRGKASTQRIKIGQPADIEIGLDECGEFGLAGAII